MIKGAALKGEGNGLDSLPIPVSTPGFDSAPTLTATNVITKDPETGIQNHGTYRAGLKAPDRCVIRMATRVGGAGGYRHYLKHQKRGDKTMPCAIVLGAPPCVAFVAPMKLPIDLDEIGVAGAVAGRPINVVRALTVDLLVPAEAEIVIEGLIDTVHLEPEGPFGESHGHIAPEEYNMPMRVTAITHRKDAIVASYLSQVTPSESSAIKRVSYEPMFLSHLRNTLGVRGVKRVTLHERMTALRRIAIVTVEKGTPRTEIWRALTGASSFKADCGKICIAVNEDIDPDNSDAILWAIAFRMDPVDRPPGAALSQPGTRARARARGGARGRDAADGRHHEGRPAAARAAEAGIHGARAQGVGGARAAQAAPAVAVVQLARGERLAATVGRGGEARCCGSLSRNRPHQREATAQRSEAGDARPA